MTNLLIPNYHECHISHDYRRSLHDIARRIFALGLPRLLAVWKQKAAVGRLTLALMGREGHVASYFRLPALLVRFA